MTGTGVAMLELARASASDRCDPRDRMLAVRACNRDDVAVRNCEPRQLGAHRARRLEQRRAALAELQRQHRVIDILWEACK